MHEGYELSRLAPYATETNLVAQRPASTCPPAHGAHPLPLINERFDPARAIAKRTIAHSNDGQ